MVDPQGGRSAEALALSAEEQENNETYWVDESGEMKLPASMELAQTETEEETNLSAGDMRRSLRGRLDMARQNKILVKLMYLHWERARRLKAAAGVEPDAEGEEGDEDPPEEEEGGLIPVKEEEDEEEQERAALTTLNLQRAMRTMQTGPIRVLAGDEELSSFAGTEQLMQFPPLPPPIRGVGGRAGSVTSENTELSEMLWPGAGPTHADVAAGVAEYIKQETMEAHTRQMAAKTQMAERYKATLNPFDRAWRAVQDIASRRHPLLVPNEMKEGLMKWQVTIETCKRWARMSPIDWQRALVEEVPQFNGEVLYMHFDWLAEMVLVKDICEMVEHELKKDPMGEEPLNELSPLSGIYDDMTTEVRAFFVGIDVDSMLAGKRRGSKADKESRNVLHLNEVRDVLGALKESSIQKPEAHFKDCPRDRKKYPSAIVQWNQYVGEGYLDPLEVSEDPESEEDVEMGEGDKSAPAATPASAITPLEGSFAGVGSEQSGAPPSAAAKEEVDEEAAPTTPVFYTDTRGSAAPGTPPSSLTTLEEAVGEMAPMPAAKASPKAAALVATAERGQAEEDAASERLESIPEDTEMLHESSEEDEANPRRSAIREMLGGETQGAEEEPPLPAPVEGPEQETQTEAGVAVTLPEESSAAPAVRMRDSARRVIFGEFGLSDAESMPPPKSLPVKAPPAKALPVKVPPAKPPPKAPPKASSVYTTTGTGDLPKTGPPERTTRAGALIKARPSGVDQ